MITEEEKEMINSQLDEMSMKQYLDRQKEKLFLQMRDITILVFAHADIDLNAVMADENFSDEIKTLFLHAYVDFKRKRNEQN